MSRPSDSPPRRGTARGTAPPPLPPPLAGGLAAPGRRLPRRVPPLRRHADLPPARRRPGLQRTATRLPATALAPPPLRRGRSLRCLGLAAPAPLDRRGHHLRPRHAPAPPASRRPRAPCAARPRARSPPVQVLATEAKADVPDLRPQAPPLPHPPATQPQPARRRPLTEVAALHGAASLENRCSRRQSAVRLGHPPLIRRAPPARPRGTPSPTAAGARPPPAAPPRPPPAEPSSAPWRRPRDSPAGRPAAPPDRRAAA